MIEAKCQSCGAKESVESLLAAASQPCGRCGRLLSGPLARGTNTARPSNFAETPLPRPATHATGSPAWLWLGMFAGALAGVALVGAVAVAGSALPLPLRGGVLGALTGVLLSPFLAMGTFLSMLVLPWTLEGMLGDSMWTRLAKALHERRLRPLFFPLLVFVVLPMALCGLGGSRMKAIATPMVMSAGLGAFVLGAVAGGMCGALAGKARRARAETSSRGIDGTFLPP